MGKEETTLEQRLRSLLGDFSYQSSYGPGRRSLKQHHIDALVEDLLPFIKNECQELFAQVVYAGSDFIGMLDD